MGGGTSKTSALSREDLTEYVIVERLIEEEEKRDKDGDPSTQTRFSWDNLPPEQAERLHKGFLKLENAATRDKNGKVIYDHDLNSGDAEAMWRYAMLLSAGRGCKKDEPRAVEMLKWAHRRQHVDAAYALADMYFTDRGMDVVQPYFNQFRGVVLWQWCADRGHVPSHIKLAHAYRTGLGVRRKDDQKAAEHFAKATNQSVAEAASHIADMYENGTGGVKKDECKAAARYQTASDQGHADSMYKLGSMYMEGRGVEKSYTNARGLLDKSVAQGNADAQYHMAILLRKTDPFKAIGLINHAARQGHVKAQAQRARLRKGLQLEDEEIAQGSYQNTVSKVKQATAKALLKKRSLLAGLKNAPVPPPLVVVEEEPNALPPVAVGSRPKPPTTPMSPTFASVRRIGASLSDNLMSMLSPQSVGKKKDFSNAPSPATPVGAVRLRTIESGTIADDGNVETGRSSALFPAIKGAAPKEAPMSPLQRLGKVFSRKPSKSN